MAVSDWISATRPKTLAAGIAPVAVGSALGAVEQIDYIIAVLCLLGALCIQIGCNFANDALDAIKGADNNKRIGPQRAVASGRISAKHMLAASAFILLIAFLIGVYLSLIGGWIIFALGLISIVCAYAYTGGPFPLAYIGLGDLFVYLFFGLFAVLGTAYMQSAAHNINSAQIEAWWYVIASAVGLQATAIIAVNNLRDRKTDAEVGKRTLAVLLGGKCSRIYMLLLHISACACLAAVAYYLKYPSFYIPAAIAGIGGIALSIGVFLTDGAQLNRYLGLSAALELITGLSIAYFLAQSLA